MNCANSIMLALYIHSVIQGKCCLSKATPQELAAAGKPSASNPTAAKAKAKATARGTKKIQPPSPAHEETPVKSPPKKVPKDIQEIPPRRLNFKGQDPEPSRQISSLQKAGSH